MTEPAFSLTGAGVRIKDTWLLHPTDLTIAKGRVTGLLGHNGSGKSTMMSLLARAGRPSVGSVHLDGEDCGGFGARAYARRVAFLPQDPAVSDSLTVREMVEFGRYPWHGALGRFTKTDRQSVDRALDLSGLLPFADRLVATLSGGERQRSFVAMMVAQDASCLLLDEPISALDIASQIAVMSLLRSLSETQERTVVVVLHDINIAARFCDELIALSAGRLVAQAQARELMTADNLKRIYGLPMGVMVPPEGGAPISYAL
ncbi:Iron(3+)-hydroxamate import ATP-binding protein FhuC [Hartmannibacter diazotrophicus]|uniref:Iron(3+)-hydroxamate import ATP-binding protein FhuC n=1 Tax=Hartmannibacter diazotrophicus TaxID=1482074 RepID=A0A2C9D8U0_9HYPH|nr:ATP-binding cassette domain-containing protein [Hartmannibacter diazotrophicus]SON56676.1 Iron(3+)-hydroxamate import ATP-binding protein FhuC [Hartmannibacter diazotrophicus]